MLERKANSIAYSSVPFSPTSGTNDKLKELLASHNSKAPKDSRKRHIFSNDRENSSSQQTGKEKKTFSTLEDDNSMFSNTDEHSKLDIHNLSTNPPSRVEIDCPYCHRRIETSVNGAIEDLKTFSSNSMQRLKLEGTQLSEKVKTHYFPAKKNFLSESLNNSHLNDVGSVFEFKARPLSNRNILNIQKSLDDLPKGDDMSNLLYELAEHKAKLAAALHTNDENLYNLQKKQFEIKQLQLKLIEKDKEYQKLEKENFMIKQENYKCKATIHELNVNQKMLLKDFNKFTKLQITSKS